MSTEAKDGSAAMVTAQWREASLQIDNHRRIIKLDLQTLDRLGVRGEAHFVFHFRSVNNYYPLYQTEIPRVLFMPTNASCLQIQLIRIPAVSSWPSRPNSC
ncbi:hypothetical protein F5Y03DRAFT_352651 [Xylaria venustula]|nr:hypothetical protein F5Y03DRAFT_352651 [Xylaria venustula]